MPSTPRPAFLNVFQIHLPIAGVMSIIHRVTGLAMVLLIPVLLWTLETSLRSEEGFAEVQQMLDSAWTWLLVFLSSWGLLHHVLAGIRFLLIDFDIGVERPTYRYSAWLVMLLAPLLAAVLTGGLL